MKLLETIVISSIDASITDGIFTTINTLKNDIPFLIDDNYKHIDNDYYFNNSGNKNISTTYERIYNIFKNDNENIRRQKTIQMLARIIINRYVDNWVKIYNAYFLTDYKPLENYSMIEEENITAKDSVNTQLSTTNSGEDNGNIYPLTNTNINGTPFSKTTNTNTQQLSGSKENNYTDRIHDKTLIRSGNIGVTTSQQMLESELNLRKYDFFQQVFKDVDKILCSYIYEF